MRNILVAMGALALASCGSETSETVTESGAEISVEEASGETSIKVETPDGVATMRSGADMPVELPHGLTVYPGAKVTSNSQVEHSENENPVVLLSFETEDSPAKVAEFYRENAAQNNIEISIDSTIDGGVMMIGETPGGAAFSLTVQSEEDVTTASLATGL